MEVLEPSADQDGGDMVRGILAKMGLYAAKIHFSEDNKLDRFLKGTVQIGQDRRVGMSGSCNKVIHVHICTVYYIYIYVS